MPEPSNTGNFELGAPIANLRDDFAKEHLEEKLHLVERRSKISTEGDRISKIKDPVERLNAYEALLKEIENGI